ncbi:hypothetical protein [Burkholderia gladioli]|uniref:hypothetical protein n=1 Tax=Burkholderia gladioli TaxID=28095 RepID=UPI000CFEE0B2|nr:hypothetical protein [Burkholderia gladioli]MBU9190840.1 hypothetical protein [Burkholderia gladioli]MBU9277576.1 hypothetical protein [Burkholderia gladioli]MBU9687180.1 hypothetical protein [Burkholderia gladioli]PRE13762.1 hypothetical protein C6P72_29690 [Burkholderia gladioli]
MLNAIETRTPPTIEDLAGISSDVSSLVEAIVAEVVEIDKALLALDELLNFLQSPRTGKIRIE